MMVKRIDKNIIKINLWFYIIGVLIFYLGCKEPFNPDINEKVDVIAVDGSLIKGKGKQVVVITRSAPLNDIQYLPVKNCTVKIIDELGNEFQFTEESEGRYTAEINEDMLVNQRKYKLHFTTPDGNIYESTDETIIATAPVDSVYAEHESIFNTTSQEYDDVLKYYLDLKAPDEGARYYRWDLTETYEIHSNYYIDGIYLGHGIIFTPQLHDSIYYCWITKDIDQLFSSSTENLQVNEKKKIPLIEIGPNSKKMAVRYSLLVKQYALSKDAYVYWHQKKVELEESGGLYSSQPGQTKSNIVNINDSQENVLGYFWVSSLSEKRVFYDEPYTYYKPFGYCDAAVFDSATFDNGDYPIYISGGIRSPALTADRQCFDCTLLGGSLEKPSFW